MKRVLSFCLVAFAASTASASFSGFTYQRAITINHAQVSTGTLTYTNFPVVVSTNDVTLSTAVAGGHLSNANAYDLIFSTMNDCSFDLFWDTETFNSSGTATLNAWVNIPSVSSSTDTTFYMCYGNSSITTYQGSAQKAWNNNYLGVYHLSETITAAGQNANDSTVNVSSLTAETQGGEAWGAASQVPGQIDGSQNFDGVASGRFMDHSFLFANNASRTISLWAKPNNSNESQWMVTQANTPADGISNWTVLQHGTIFSIYHGGSYRDGITAVSAGTWYRLDYVFNSGTNAYALYLNGNYTPEASGTSADTGANNNRFLVGTGFLPGDATIDQVEAQNTAQSIDWIRTEYKNQFSPSTFETIGAETTGNAPVVIPANSFSITGGKMSISGAKIAIK